MGAGRAGFGLVRCRVSRGAPAPRGLFAGLLTRCVANTMGRKARSRRSGELLIRYTGLEARVREYQVLIAD